MMITSVRKNGTLRVQLQLDSESRVEQSHEGSTDINAIIRKAQKTGELPAPVGEGLYGDFSTAVDFHECQNRLIAADGMFMALPAELRKVFGNDAGSLLEFVNNPENLEEAQEMGLLPRKEKPAPDAPPPADAPPAPPEPPAAALVEPAAPVVPAV